jgi:amidophosphoribosyltransferase
VSFFFRKCLKFYNNQVPNHLMELREKCGVFGIYSETQFDVSRSVYFGLWALQHRGQENSGISASNGSKINTHKGRGLVAHVYKDEDFNNLKGNIAIGHNRYSTFGGSIMDHSQPVISKNNIFALAHNGNLPVVKELYEFLVKNNVDTKDLNDSEMMQRAIELNLLKSTSITEAVKNSYNLFKGAFAIVAMTKDSLVAFRESHGIRPLSLASLGDGYCVSSETCAFEAVGAEFIRDIEPGELIIINKDGLHSHKLAEPKYNLDIFEYIYFARPDSILQGQTVYDVRKRLGNRLAEETRFDISSADIVVPVPDSAVASAIGYSEISGIPLEMALVKNKYIGRTFIAPSQQQREIQVKTKLSVIKSVLKGKRVVVIDDSIVRGTTTKKIARLLRDSGAKEIHLMIPSPPVIYPDFYGIDTPLQSDLIAANMSINEITKFLGVDSLNYISYNGMIDAIGLPESELCTSCFTGRYPVEIGEGNRTGIKHII